MASPVTSSAVARVLDLPELLTLILEFLPCPAIFQAQRICRSWRECINSTTLQEQLFLKPIQRERSATPPSYNDYLVHAFSGFFGSLNTNPIMPWTSTTHSAMPWTKDAKAIQAFTRAEASWRRMLVRQPPPRLLKIREEVEAESTNEHKCNYIHFTEERPFTMGLLYDIGQSYILGGPGSGSFRIQWPAREHQDAAAPQEMDEDEARREATDCVRIVLFDSFGCCPDKEPPLDTRFESRGATEVHYDVEGEWTSWNPHWMFD